MRKYVSVQSIRVATMVGYARRAGAKYLYMKQLKDLHDAVSAVIQRCNEGCSPCLDIVYSVLFTVGGHCG